MKRLICKYNMLRWSVYFIVLIMTVVTSDFCYALPDMDPGSIDWSSVSYTAAFPKKVGSNLVWYETKIYLANSNLIDSHCKTDYGTKLEHAHFQSNFSGSDLTYANAFWDWFYPTASRISGATNQTNCLCYAMDGYAGNANYDYWVNPGHNGQQGNEMFMDDCNIRNPYHDVETDDRLGYMFTNPDYTWDIGHATIVLDESGSEPTCLEWKNNASGVYQFDPYAAADRYSTPGCSITSQTPLVGTYEPDYYPGDAAIGFYDW